MRVGRGAEMEPELLLEVLPEPEELDVEGGGNRREVVLGGSRWRRRGRRRRPRG